MPHSLGLDFGTTNSVLARVGPDGEAHTLPIRDDDRALHAVRSVLAFAEAAQGGVETTAGPRAIRRFLEDPEACRFLQSMKTFAASPLFEGTTIYGTRYTFDGILRTFLECLRSYAGEALRDLPERLVVGRPVAFAGAQADEKLAMARYESALSALGFSEILYVYEPVAAAFYFARRLRGSATVLVADLGGGTSDFSLIRFTVEGGHVHGEPLGYAGVGVAGDNFDYRIIDHAILPHLGKGSTYRSMGKIMEIPAPVFGAFARWNQLSVLKSTREYREIQRYAARASEPEKLDRLLSLIEEEQGHALYQAVSDAKTRLSSQASTELRFAPLGRDFVAPINRDDFERWIAPDMARIEGALDEALANAGVKDRDVDRVFLTGGTSFVHAVRTLMTSRFAHAGVESGSELLSIASGLALIGELPDPSDWLA